MTTSDITSQTVEIQLTKGYVAIVDEQDADLALRRWHYLSLYAGYHERISGKHVAFLMHRIILERSLKRKLLKYEKCDHINGNHLDNRRCNLRIANHTQNMRNSKIRVNNTSGYKGVYKKRNKWAARIKVNGKNIWLGVFVTPELAYFAYCEAAKKYHGEFARIK
jgi:hypothetical protein